MFITDVQFMDMAESRNIASKPRLSTALGMRMRMTSFLLPAVVDG